MQWLFGPLLALAALAWLCLRLAAVRSAIGRMPSGRRVALFALAAGLIAFAGTKTNAPSALPPHPLLALQPVAPPVTNMRWLLRGACEDAVRLPFPSEDGFPWRYGVATALTVFAYGEFRPDAQTPCFPPPCEKKWPRELWYNRRYLKTPKQ